MISRAERVLSGLSGLPGAAALVGRLPLRWARSSRAYEGDLRLEAPRRHAIVSTVTDNFMGPGAVFLLSLQERLANRAEVDVILVQSAEVAPLSGANREALARLCPGLRFVDVDARFLTAENMRRYDPSGRPVGVKVDATLLPSKRAAYVKLNVLRFTQYERVLLMDSDLMVLDDVSELFSIAQDIAAVRGGRRRDAPGRSVAHRWSGRGRFNSGVLLLGRACRGEAPFNAAVDFLDALRDKPFRDQSALNHVFRRAGKAMLPNAYNYMLNASDPDMLDDPAALDRARIVHFAGPTKWGLKDPANRGKALYDRFHEIHARTGLPFVLEG